MRAGWLGGGLAAVITSAVMLGGSGAGLAATGSAARADSAGAAPGSVLWTSARAGSGNTIAADPQGGMVFAAGSGFLDAYDSGTGAELWDNSAGGGQFVAVSPDGQDVFVTKAVHATGGADYSTAAFDAATGRQLWVSRYNGRADGTDRPVALAVSPGGGTVYVTGFSRGRTTGLDYATLAYAAATGRQLWVSRFNGHGRGGDYPAAIAVSPGGGTVFVTGTSLGSNAGDGFATVAYAAASGTPRWTRRFYQPDGRNAASSMAVSRDGRTVFVTGDSRITGSGTGFATVAYTASTGATLWVRRYHRAGDRSDSPGVVLASPLGGGTVVVAGEGAGSGRAFLGVAYGAATGRTRWVSRFVDDGMFQEYLGGAVLSPDARSLYLAGLGYVVPGGEEPSQDLTVAVRVATGAQIWSQVVTTGLPDEAGGPVAVSPDGGAVYIGVQDFTATEPHDFTTVALRA